MTEAVMKCCEPIVYGSYIEKEDALKGEKAKIDVGSRLRGMWA
jgi:hypothetical protein